MKNLGFKIPHIERLTILILIRCLFITFVCQMISLISVIQALVALIHVPEPEHPLRSDLAKEYMEDKARFNKNAKDYTSKFAEQRN